MPFDVKHRVHKGQPRPTCNVQLLFPSETSASSYSSCSHSCHIQHELHKPLINLPVEAALLAPAALCGTRTACKVAVTMWGGVRHAILPYKLQRSSFPDLSQASRHERWARPEHDASHHHLPCSCATSVFSRSTRCRWGGALFPPGTRPAVAPGRPPTRLPPRRAPPAACGKIQNVRYCV